MTRKDSDEIEVAPIPLPGKDKPARSDSSGIEDAPIEVAPIPGARPSTPKPRPSARLGIKKLPRDLIEGYELLEFLGEGTMGAVIKGRQLSLDRPVAIKILTPRLAENEAFLRRFLREARAVAKLNHPNIVSGIDVGEARGCHYFVMEFVEGPTLLEVVEQRGKLPEKAATRITKQVAAALGHAHKNRLVHRDVKPANVILTRGGQQAKLLDLGLAKEVSDDAGDTAEGRPMGTPSYISPEQARGERTVDIRSDIYSLGATYFHAVTGRVPFEGQTAAVVMAKHLTEPLPAVQVVNPQVSLGCASIITKMMSKDPDARHQTPEELVEELEKLERGEWQPDKPKIRRRRRRRFR